MARSGLFSRFSLQPTANRLTSVKGAWVYLSLAVLAILLLFGFFGQAENKTAQANAPASSESTRVSQLLERFPDADQHSVLLVAAREDGGKLSGEDLKALGQNSPKIGKFTGVQATGPIPSKDGEAAVIITGMKLDGDNADTAEAVKDLRSQVSSLSPQGVKVFVTGGPAFGADITSAFDGADFTLLAVTIVIVALLLIITYRSPILWLIPLIVVAIADRLAGLLTAALGNTLSLQFDAGIISVLVFGAGTNYALLLISRYREELLRHENHRKALAAAWAGSTPAILASNLTVVLALLTLGLALIPGTRGLGISSALGLLIALTAVLFVLPPLLAICGRKIFWPLIPRPGSTQKVGNGWKAIASFVMGRPRRSFAAALSLLAIMSAGLWGTSVGLTQAEKFRVTSESADGLTVLSQHFDAGEAQPLTIVTRSSQAEEVSRQAGSVPGVVRATITGTSTDGSLSKITVTGESAPGTPESLDLVSALRDRVHAVKNAEALVGGPTAAEVDSRNGNLRDFLLIVPLILIVNFGILAALLRSLLAPTLLMIVNIISAVAAIGAGAWLSRVFFNQHALDTQVPLLSFLFLVALGIDYTIFLVHRARHEAQLLNQSTNPEASDERTHPTKEGMLTALAHTGSVITSAGVVLAGVFAALGFLPLVTLGQLGLIVGLGVLVDTLVVRTVVIPSLFSLVGEKMWWPSRLGRQQLSQTQGMTPEKIRERI